LVVDGLKKTTTPDMTKKPNARERSLVRGPWSVVE
jgi:hypothetical protein